MSSTGSWSGVGESRLLDLDYGDIPQRQHGRSPNRTLRTEAWEILNRNEKSLSSQAFLDGYFRLAPEERTQAILLEIQYGRIQGPLSVAQLKIEAQIQQYGILIAELQSQAERRVNVEAQGVSLLAESRQHRDAGSGPRVFAPSEVIDLTGDSPGKSSKRKFEGVGKLDVVAVPPTKRLLFNLESHVPFEKTTPESKMSNPESIANDHRQVAHNISKTAHNHRLASPTDLRSTDSPFIYRAHEFLGSQKSTSIWAVKVGWIPGIYNKEDATLQTYHYPNKEYKRFKSKVEAESWLAIPSADSTIDTQNRSPNYERIDRHTWTRFLERTWDHRNRDHKFGYREIRKILRRLFLEACSFDDMIVDWSIHQLPQHILAIAEQQDIDILRSGNLLQQETLRRSDFLPMVEAKGACDCGVFAPMASDVIICANQDCPIVLFHKSCVGMAKRPDTGVWPCRHCRPTSVPNLSFSRTSFNDDLEPPTIQVETLAPSYVPLARAGVLRPPLHEEQQRVVDCILQGNNVFYSGSAGVGKSTVLTAFVQRLKAKGRQVDIVAPSGIAALNVGGMTIFSYAGWHPDSFKEPLHKLCDQAYKKTTFKRLNKTDVLVIDEISMVEADMLVRLDTVMRKVRGGWFPERHEKKLSPHDKNLPFGGAQIICTGDFLQLPPVRPFRFCVHCGGEELKGYHAKTDRPLECHRCHRIYEDKDKWAFRAGVWKKCNFQYFELRHIHRQSDARFIAILQRCRFGDPLTDEDKRLLLANKPEPVGAVKLLPRKIEVDLENKKNFEGLKAVQRTFECLDHFSYLSQDEPELKKKSVLKYSNRPEGPLLALKDHRLEETIHLKEGMLVILLANLDFKQGLVNGSQGKIIGFEKHDPYKVFPPQDGPASNQMGRPRVTANTQGDAPQSEYNGLKESLIQRFVDRAKVKQWPVVEFLNGVVQPIYPQCQTSEFGLEKPYSVLARTQVPLLAAWAITVHRSQGMTLNRVMVDLHNSFEQQQVYVALSRARSLEGLKVVRLASRINTGINHEVHEFLKEHDMIWKN